MKNSQEYIIGLAEKTLVKGEMKAESKYYKGKLFLTEQGKHSLNFNRMGIGDNHTLDLYAPKQMTVSQIVSRTDDTVIEKNVSFQFTDKCSVYVNGYWYEVTAKDMDCENFSDMLYFTVEKGVR